MVFQCRSKYVSAIRWLVCAKEQVSCCGSVTDYVARVIQTGRFHRQVCSDIYARWRHDDRASADTSHIRSHRRRLIVTIVELLIPVLHLRHQIACKLELEHRGDFMNSS